MTLPSFLTSKSLWTNIVALAGFAVQMKTGFVVSPELQGAALAGLNAILHGFTNKASDAAVANAATAVVAPIIENKIGTTPADPRNGVKTANEVVAVVTQIADAAKTASDSAAPQA